MLREWCKKNEQARQVSGPCDTGQRLLAGLNDAGCEAEWLSSLLEVLADHLDQVSDRIDPKRSAKLGADVARIARDFSARMSERMIATEERAAGPPEA